MEVDACHYSKFVRAALFLFNAIYVFKWQIFRMKFSLKWVLFSCFFDEIDTLLAYCSCVYQIIIGGFYIVVYNLCIYYQVAIKSTPNTCKLKTF